MAHAVCICAGTGSSGHVDFNSRYRGSNVVLEIGSWDFEKCNAQRLIEKSIGSWPYVVSLSKKSKQSQVMVPQNKRLCPKIIDAWVGLDGVWTFRCEVEMS